MRTDVNGSVTGAHTQTFFYANNQWTEVNSPIFNPNNELTQDVQFQGMNQSGQVLATYGHLVPVPNDPYDFTYVYDGSFLWVNGIITKIRDPNAAANQTRVSDINDAGEIVGSYSGSHGFVDIRGHFQTLDYPGATTTTPQFVNDSGQIAGTFVDGDGTSHSFLYSNGKFVTFGTPGEYLTGFNNAGEVVGSYFYGEGSVSFVYSNGTYQTLEYPGSSTTQITGINNIGTVVGFCYAGPCAYGFEGTPTTTAEPRSLFLLGGLPLAGLLLLSRGKQPQFRPNPR